jgi:hypothetical protein
MTAFLFGFTFQPSSMKAYKNFQSVEKLTVANLLVFVVFKKTVLAVKSLIFALV